jgi:hypothetical protein
MSEKGFSSCKLGTPQPEKRRKPWPQGAHQNLHIDFSSGLCLTAKLSKRNNLAMTREQTSSPAENPFVLQLKDLTLAV